METIREIGGKKYQVIKTKCHCPCHTMPKGHVKHVRACCNGGYVEHLVRVKE